MGRHLPPAGVGSGNMLQMNKTPVQLISHFSMQLELAPGDITEKCRLTLTKACVREKTGGATAEWLLDSPFGTAGAFQNSKPGQGLEEERRSTQDSYGGPNQDQEGHEGMGPLNTCGTQWKANAQVAPGAEERGALRDSRPSNFKKPKQAILWPVDNQSISSDR